MCHASSVRVADKGTVPGGDRHSDGEKGGGRSMWCRAVMEALADCGSIDTEMESVSREIKVTARSIRKLADENATQKLDQHEYCKKYGEYASRYTTLER